MKPPKKYRSVTRNSRFKVTTKMTDDPDYADRIEYAPPSKHANRIAHTTKAPASEEIDILHTLLSRQHGALYQNMNDVTQRHCCAWMLRQTSDFRKPVTGSLLKIFVGHRAKVQITST